ncbi:hypothetical protein BH23GEM11_BH23GEM11_03020 [soil metagenome]
MVGFGDGEMERFRARRARPARPAEDAEEARRVAEAREEARSPGAGSAPEGECAPVPTSPKPSYPDPFSDPGPSRELEDRILKITTHIELAGHRRLQLLAEFDARRGWVLGGHASCAHWLAARAGLDLGTAREKVRVARALEDLPETSAWMALGRISFCQARALTRVATAGDEAELLQAAEGMTTAQVERMVRGWRMKSAADAVEREEERQRARSFSIVPDLDGMYVVRGRLTPEQGAMLMRAIEAAGDVLFREETHGQPYEARVALPEGARPGAGVGPGTQAASARRRADAVALLAECALGAGFGPRRIGDGGLDAEPDAENDAILDANTAPETAPASATLAPADAGSFPISGSRAGLYQVMLHVELDALREDDPTCGSGCSHLGDEVRVSHETSRRLSCDAAVVPLFLDAEGRVADAGHARHVGTPSLRRALEARDRGCRFPGCGLRFTEAHHIRHWADGGETSLENCVLLCRHHHGRLHEGGWTMDALPGGRLRFTDPSGGTHYDGRFELPRLDFERRLFPVRELMRENLRQLRGSGAAGSPPRH